MHFSGNLKENTVGLFATISKMMRRDNRLRELVHEAGGSHNLCGDEVVVEGITPEQYVAINTQLDKEFPL